MLGRMKRAVAILVALGLLNVAACGEKSEPTGSSGGQTLTVSAAASLKDAFDAYAKQFPSATVRAQFAGSDELAAQIEQGVKPDVFASANTKLPDQLFAKGLVEKPKVFAGNELVLAVPASGAKVHGLGDLAKPGTKIAVGAKTVPVGSYTLQVLDRLPAGQRQAVLGNIRSEEPDVKGVVGKIAQGAVDAGFVYRSDVKAANGQIKSIALPARLQPKVAYGVAVVKGSKHAAIAQRYIDGLVSGKGQQALRAAGFLPPP
jgi:molybdate transport system substrate-binding protein